MKRGLICEDAAVVREWFDREVAWNLTQGNPIVVVSDTVSNLPDAAASAPVFAAGANVVIDPAFECLLASRSILGAALRFSCFARRKEDEASADFDTSLSAAGSLLESLFTDVLPEWIDAGDTVSLTEAIFRRCADRAAIDDNYKMPMGILETIPPILRRGRGGVRMREWGPKILRVRPSDFGGRWHLRFLFDALRIALQPFTMLVPDIDRLPAETQREIERCMRFGCSVPETDQDTAFGLWNAEDCNRVEPLLYNEDILFGRCRKKENLRLFRKLVNARLRTRSGKVSFLGEKDPTELSGGVLLFKHWGLWSLVSTETPHPYYADDAASRVEWEESEDRDSEMESLKALLSRADWRDTEERAALTRNILTGEGAFANWYSPEERKTFEATPDTLEAWLVPTSPYTVMLTKSETPEEDSESLYERLFAEIEKAQALSDTPESHQRRREQEAETKRKRQALMDVDPEFSGLADRAREYVQRIPAELLPLRDPRTEPRNSDDVDPEILLEMAKDSAIGGIVFAQITGICPQQFYAYLGTRRVGYVRLKYGCLTCEYDGCGGEVVFQATTEGYDCFENDEENVFLVAIAKAILRRFVADCDKVAQTLPGGASSVRAQKSEEAGA